MTNIIQVVPRLFPANDGVGDYALNLARIMLREHNIQTHFVVCDPDCPIVENIESFSVHKINTRSEKSLPIVLSKINFNKVLLHYVGYGYAKRGCPEWLVKGLKYWINQTDGHLFTMFHEIHAFPNKPWTSSFWLLPWQKNIASRLISMCNHITTSQYLYSNMLTSLSKEKCLQIKTIPVFSNIGEPRQIPLLSEREPWLAIFGGKANRQKAYRDSFSELEDICKILKIEKIIDIGASIQVQPQRIGETEVMKMGQLPSPEISKLLLKCYAGFIDYNPSFLAKSSIMAAYCSHGLLPINAKHNEVEADGLKIGSHYTISKNLIKEEINNRFQTIAENANIWYKSHDLSKHGAVFIETLNSDCT